MQTILIGINGILGSKNLNLDTKIMFIRALELKIQLFSFRGSHLEIQDGRRIKWILVITIGYSMPENMGIDTKIMTLCALELS